MDKKLEDLDFGINAEFDIEDTLKKYFKGLKKKKAKNDPFDWDIDNGVLELKSRRIPHDKYDTLFFGKNKFDKGLCYQKEGMRVFYIFNCKDGIYYWEQKSEECFHKKGGRFDRGRPEVQMLTNVPIEHLKKLDTLPEIE